MNMKKEYQQPVAEVYASQTSSMLAVSIMDGKADSSTEVLVKENDWSLTEDEDSDAGIFE